MGRRSGDGAELAIIELVDNAREKEAQSSARKRTRGSGKKKTTDSKVAESEDGEKKDGVERARKGVDQPVVNRRR